MTETIVKFLDLTGIRDLERRCQDAFDNRLMLDERGELERDLDRKSLELFGITLADTLHDPADAFSQTTDAWERNFEFLEWVYDEEPTLWAAIGLDMTDDEGGPLYCIDAFGRQLVCAIRQLHPRATLVFRQTELSAAQVSAAAEAWGQALLRRDLR